MRERAERIGAGFMVRSFPGSGTEIGIELQRGMEAVPA
jgi:signal transduction histidine kinase